MDQSESNSKVAALPRDPARKLLQLQLREAVA